MFSIDVYLSLKLEREAKIWVFAEAKLPQTPKFSVLPLPPHGGRGKGIGV